MPIITAFILSLLLTYTSALSLCHFLVDDGAIYSFFGAKPQSISSLYNLDSNATISFDLCGTTIAACPTYSSSGTEFTAVIASDDDDQDCQNLADARAPAVSYFDPNNASAGVSLVFPTVSSGSTQNILVVNMTCDESVSPQYLQWTASVVFSTHGPNVYTLKSNGAPGCPAVSLQNYLAFFVANKVSFAVAMLLIGLFALFFGLRFHKVTVFIFTTTLISLVLFVIILSLSGLRSSGPVVWILYVVSLLVGLGCGYCAVRYQKGGFFAVGAIGGGVGAFFLYSMLLHVFAMTDLVMYILIFVLAVIGGLLTVWLWKHVVILVMSFVGAYMTIRAISFFAGGFPDEISVIEGLEEFDNVAYAYLVAIILVAIGGAVFQFKHRKGCKDKQEDEKDVNDVKDESQVTIEMTEDVKKVEESENSTEEESQATADVTEVVEEAP